MFLFLSFLSFSLNILRLVKLTLKKKIKISYKFYETNNFEVFCFCPILIINNQAYFTDDIDEITNRDNIKISYTDYFFVGGYDNNKNIGLIKLYKVNFYKKDINIEFIQDITININKDNKNETEKFQGFKGPISCIIQSKITSHILITCWNSYVYLFTPPNLNFFLNYNENINLTTKSLIKIQNQTENNDESLSFDESPCIKISSDGTKIEETIEKDFSIPNSKYSNNNYSNLQINNNYYFEDVIIDIKQIISKSCIKIYTNLEGDNKFLIYDDFIYGDNCNISYDIIKKSLKVKNIRDLSDENQKLNLIIMKLTKFLQNIENKIKNEFKNSFKLEIQLYFEKEKEETGDNIRCNYTFFIPNKNCINIYQDNNIFYNELSGFNFLLTDSNNEIFKDINYIKEKRKNIYVSSKSNGIDSIDSIDLSSLKKNSENLFSNSDKISNIISNIASSFLSKKNILLILQILYKKASEENIIEFLSLIGKHNHTANCIKVFSNNFWISIGNDLTY